MEERGWLHRRDAKSRLGRASAQAYWLGTALVSPGEYEEPIYRRQFPERADARRRATAPAYWLDTALVLEEEIILLPGELQRHQYEDIARGRRRAGHSAYEFVQPHFQGVDEDYEPSRVWFPERADAKRRAAASAYDFVQFAAVDQPFIEEIEGLSKWLLPDRAPRRRGAARQVYWLDTLLAPEEVAAELPEELRRQLYPDRADARRRAGIQAYRIGVALTWPGPPPTVGEELRWEFDRLPDRAYRKPRAASIAYWYATDRENVAQEPVGENPLPEELRPGIMPDRALGFYLAHDLAYEFINFPPPEAGDVPEELLALFFPHAAPRQRLAPRGIFHIGTEIAPEEELEYERGLFPDRAYRRARAAAPVYWHDTLLALAEVVELPPEITAWLMPERADARRRAGSRAYGYVEFWVDVDVPGPVEERRRKRIKKWWRSR